MQPMVDGNKRLTVAHRLRSLRSWIGSGFAWFEELFLYSEIDAYARLSASVGMPISGGERTTTLEQFRPFWSNALFGIAVQLDVACCGITRRYGNRAHGWRHGGSVPA